MELTTLAALLGIAATSNTTTLQLVLELFGDAERRLVSYECPGLETPLAVDYINAEPNFLAILPIEGHQTIFAATVSENGARYVSGPLEWVVRGPEATLKDVRGGLEPLTCSELSLTP